MIIVTEDYMRANTQSLTHVAVRIGKKGDWLVLVPAGSFSWVKGIPKSASVAVVYAVSFVRITGVA